MTTKYRVFDAASAEAKQQCETRQQAIDTCWRLARSRADETWRQYCEGHGYLKESKELFDETVQLDNWHVPVGHGLTTLPLETGGVCPSGVADRMQWPHWVRES